MAVKKVLVNFKEMNRDNSDSSHQCMTVILTNTMYRDVENMRDQQVNISF